jgi:opacity protein-like surface antigen
MRSVKSLFVAAATALLSTAAVAADMPSIAPPPPMAYPQPYPQPYPQQYAQPFAAPGFIDNDFGGWYLRGDIGMSNQSVKSLFNVLYNTPGTSVTTIDPGFDSAGIAGLGVGYQINPWLRGDITAEWRGKANFHGLDIVYFNGLPVGTDEYHASKSEFLTLLNLYADLGTWWCITPFVGAGVGWSHNTISSFTDVNTPNNGVAYGRENSQWALAYALHAGLAYKVTNNFTIEASYRWVHLGDAASGDEITFTGVNNVFNPMEFRGLTSNDFRLGVRWTCCEVPPPPPVAPPPLVRKG